MKLYKLLDLEKKKLDTRFLSVYVKASTCLYVLLGQ